MVKRCIESFCNSLFFLKNGKKFFKKKNWQIKSNEQKLGIHLSVVPCYIIVIANTRTIVFISESSEKDSSHSNVRIIITVVKGKTHPAITWLNISPTHYSLFGCSEVAWPPSTGKSIILLNKKKNTQTKLRALCKAYSGCKKLWTLKWQWNIPSPSAGA